MYALAEWTEHSREQYHAIVNERLWTRCGETVDSLHAGNAVRACQLAGLSPCECFRWLTRVDGLC